VLTHVAGTNTDAVALRLSPEGKNLKDQSVLAHFKTPTTPDATEGIAEAVGRVMESASIGPSRVSSVTIGTTHFINAVIERDARRLRPVAILRVSRSYLRETPPFAEWPVGLADILFGYVGYVDGGVRIDGAEEAPIVEEQIVDEARKIKELGLAAIVVAGTFSPIDDVYKQEDRIRDIILREIPNADVVASHTVANIGFMERENASILNAAIIRYARKTIKSFRTAIRDLGLTCPLYITQNDGTVVDASVAAKVPIRTFLSGPTNSMRGAAFLSGLNIENSQSIVIDIGGTTSDLGVLLPSGLPRQAAAYVKVAGVDVNYTMPHLHSIGLGGGSLVREEQGIVQVGPKSVGNELTKSALVFGGDKLTATDIVVAAGAARVGDPTKVAHLQPDLVEKARSRIKQMLERAVDVIKLSPEPLPVLLVGGGAILAPEDLQGASKLIRPPYYDVANAVGAAISRVCGLVDIIQSTADQTVAEAIERAKQQAIQKALKAGALEGTVEIAEVDYMPVSYVSNRLRTVVKAIGDLSTVTESKSKTDLIDEETEESVEQQRDVSTSAVEVPGVDPLTYRPQIATNALGVAEWLVSETDLQYLADGCYVLGCAGGGSPRATKIQLTNMLRQGYTMRIVDASSLQPEDVVIGGGGLGSPAVGVERLPGIETIGAIKILLDYLRVDKCHAVMPTEIGGANGIAPLVIGSSRFYDVPVIDGDWMGRAYPTAWQTTLCAHESGQLTPCAIDAGDGNSIIMTSSSNDKMVDSILRAGCVEMGSAVGAATNPNTTKQIQDYGVLRTCSLAWRIGRCIAQNTATSSLSTIAEAIVDEAGGQKSAKVLFRGKIIEVENMLSKGHSYGVVHIQAFEADDEQDPSSAKRSAAVAQGGTLKVPFKNENIYVEHTTEDGTGGIIASVPDLIAILDNGSGKALGVPEFRYGYRVTVIGITCSPRWVDTPKALEIGGPKSFGFDHEYVPLGEYVSPRSVIDEFRPR
jgi:N-methylhydantoinase A/oxoprolinase/acetone carboxylase beta subunit/DUF917 family protein